MIACCKCPSVKASRWKSATQLVLDMSKPLNASKCSLSCLSGSAPHQLYPPGSRFFIPIYNFFFWSTIPISKLDSKNLQINPNLKNKIYPHLHCDLQIQNFGKVLLYPLQSMTVPVQFKILLPCTTLAYYSLHPSPHQYTLAWALHS